MWHNSIEVTGPVLPWNSHEWQSSAAGGVRPPPPAAGTGLEVQGGYRPLLTDPPKRKRLEQENCDGSVSY